MLFPCPEKRQDGTYRVHFFSQGLRYLPTEAAERVNRLSSGDQLFLMPDPQNPKDAFAIALRTDDPATIVGYCPRYLSRDFLRLLYESSSTTAAVAKVNLDAPLQQRLLCRLEADWPKDFVPCSDDEFAPLASLSETQPAA